eukprot:6455036-Amphidinium_carterae.2
MTLPDEFMMQSVIKQLHQKASSTVAHAVSFAPIAHNFYDSLPSCFCPAHNAVNHTPPPAKLAVHFSPSVSPS